MRVSTNQIYNTGIRNIQNKQSDLNTLENQMSTGNRMVTAADDPVGAARALVISQKMAVNTQYMTNQSNADSALSELDTQLSAITDKIQDIQSNIVNAGNGTYSDSDRAALATELQQQLNSLLSFANATDSTGQYMFSGSKGNTEPFSISGGTATYAGNDSERTLQVSSSQNMETSVSGSDLFMRVAQGNGTFSTAAGSSNTGTGVVSVGSVVSGYDGHTYSLTFTSATTYDLVDTDPVTGTSTTTTGLSYTSGDSIVLGSSGEQISISISGTPAAGDTFDVAEAGTKDIFSTMSELISALQTSTDSDDVADASLQNVLNQASANLSQFLDTVTTVQTKVGANLSTLESLTSTSTDLDTEYQSQLSDLQDLDYIQAESDLAKNTTILEAALSAFTTVTSLSLFNYL
jgi:flagellar hook-associated protein 3 FlgL